MIYDISKLLRQAHARVGIKENPSNSNNVDCNTWYYGHAVADGKPNKGDTYPWCAVEMSYIFHLVGYDNLIIKTASCATMGNWFKKNGQFFKEPQVGDLVFYKFKTNRNNNWTNHVGLVVDVLSNGTIRTIEGNTSITSNDNGGSVMLRTRDLKNVVGFGRPLYYGTVSEPTKAARATLRYGSKSPDVKYLHQRLRKFYYGVNAEQDFFDSLTKTCVIDFQANHNLEPDGIVGPKTWEKLEVKN